MPYYDKLLKKFDTNSWDYEVLSEAASAVSDIPGLSLEIGMRTGGSSKIMIDEYLKTPHIKRTHIGLDPYGSLPYYWSINDPNVKKPGPYTNEFRDFVIPGLFLYCAKTNINFIFYQLTDNEFMKRFSDGIPTYCYEGKSKLLSQYAIVFHDGIHDTTKTLRNTLFFSKRSTIGSIMVYDDIYEWYNHKPIEIYLFNNGWKIKTKTNKKASYIKYE